LKLIFVRVCFMKSRYWSFLLSENNPLIIIIFAWRTSFLKRREGEQIIHVNEKLLADETEPVSRLDSKFPVTNGATLSSLVSFTYRRLLFVSEHCNLAIYGLQATLSLSLFSSLYVGASKRRVTECHIIMQFTANRCYHDEFRYSCGRDLNFSPKKRNENF